jgi:hypothetical protein
MIKVSANRRYLETTQGEPFFWLGDTAWELIHRLRKEEITAYLDDRRAKGFNVIQTVILAELDGIRIPNAYGQRPLVDEDPARINEAYFELVDFVLDQAERRGMLVGLLPSWGDKVVLKWGAGPLVFTPDNAAAYGRILGERYAGRRNLVWILGGDRVPETPGQRAIFEGLAKGIRRADSRHLMSYHPLGLEKASDHFDVPWLDVDMFQSAHSNRQKEYRYVADCRAKSAARPVVNGEARYENIGNAFWEKDASGWLDDYDVRVSAWWSMLAGAAGYTYGCNDVWQMYETGRAPVIQARTDWQEALHLPGSRQVGIMKDFLSRLPWQGLLQDQSFLANDENPENQDFIVCAATAERDLLLAYAPTGKPIRVDLGRLDAAIVRCWWFNPRSGRSQAIGECAADGPKEFAPWAKGRGSDFLLVVADSEAKYAI